MATSAEDIKPGTSLAMRILALFLKKPKTENSSNLVPTTDSDDGYRKVIDQIKGMILDLVNHKSLEEKQNLADKMSLTLLRRGRIEISEDELMEFVMCSIDQGEENVEPLPDQPATNSHNAETIQIQNVKEEVGVEVKTESQVRIKEESPEDLPYIPVSVVGPEIIDLSISEPPSPQIRQDECEVEILEDRRAKRKEARKREEAERRELERLRNQQARTLRAMRVDCPALHDLWESGLQTLLLPSGLSTYEQLFRWRQAYGETNDMEPRSVISTLNLIQLANAKRQKNIQTIEEINSVIDIDDGHVVNEIYQILVQGADVYSSAPINDDENEMRNTLCFNCQQRGHIEDFCPFEKVNHHRIPEEYGQSEGQRHRHISSGSSLGVLRVQNGDWLPGPGLPRQEFTGLHAGLSESASMEDLLSRNPNLYGNEGSPLIVMEEERIARRPLRYFNNIDSDGTEHLYRYRRNVWSGKWEPQFGSAEALQQSLSDEETPNPGEIVPQLFHYPLRGQEILDEQKERRAEAERLGMGLSATEWRWPSSHNWTPQNGDTENQSQRHDSAGPGPEYTEPQDVLPRPSDNSALAELVDSELQTHLSPRNLARYELLFQWRKSHADIQGAMPKDVLSTTKLVELANAAPGFGEEGLAMIRNTLGNERSILAGRIQEVLSTLPAFVKLPYGRICHNCFQKGHFDDDCPFDKNRQEFRELREAQRMRMAQAQAQAQPSHLNTIVPALNKCRINWRKKKPKAPPKRPRLDPVNFYSKNKWRVAARFRQ